MKGSLRHLFSLFICASLVLLHGVLAWRASVGNSPTVDEPVHAVGAICQTQLGDFRIDADNPPLFKYIAAIPQPAGVIRIDRGSPDWAGSVRDSRAGQRVVLNALFDSPGVDADGIIRRSRAMMIGVSIVLDIVLCVVAWRFAGSVAGIVAAILYSLDPNFLAHAGIVKNDVPFALAFFLFSIALLAIGRRIMLLRILAVAAAATACLTIKFSGVLVLPVLLIVLLIRAAWAAPWSMLRRNLTTRLQRVIAAIAVCFVTSILCVGGVWCVYLCRFGPTPDAQVHFDFDHVLDATAVTRFAESHPGRMLTNAEVAALRAVSDPATRMALFARRHRLLPEAYIYGMMLTRSLITLRNAFLLGAIRPQGWWYYFPLAMAFKTPLTTIGAAIVAFAMAIYIRPSMKSWALIALTIPPCVYFASATSSNLNIGVRHILPVYPFVFLAIGCIVARVGANYPTAGRWLPVVIALPLAIETFAAYPRYISFFNFPSRIYGPERLLGDSNLDWGQDLARLAAWQRENADVPLMLCYFGSVPPAHYGIRCTLLPGSSPIPGAEFPAWRGVLAISVTNLQGIYFTPELRSAYAPLRSRKPLQVIGDSIYLYNYP